MIVALLPFLNRDGFENLVGTCPFSRASKEPDRNECQITRTLVWEGLQLKFYKQKKADVI